MVLNALLFQLTWFALVLDWFDGVLGPLFLSLMMIHILLTLNVNWQMISLMVVATVLGGVGDSMMMHFSVYDFGKEATHPMLPFWLIGLWLGFSMTLLYSLSWLVEKPIFFVMFATILGPMSYLIGQELGAKIEINTSALHWMIIQWFLMGLVVVFFYKKWVKPDSQPSTEGSR